MKIIIWATAIMAALILGVVLARSGVLDLTGALVLIVGGLAGAALTFTSIRKGL